MSHRRGRCAPRDPAYAASNTTPRPSSRSNVMFHVCKYWLGVFGNCPLVEFNPLTFCRDTGIGFDTVSSKGFDDDAENVVKIENGYTFESSSYRYTESLPKKMP